VRHATIQEKPRRLVPLLTVDQVADLLAVKKSWIYDQVQQGRFCTVTRPGRQIRVHPDDLADWIDAQRDS
jgi:excisionase family DNA binding protein